MRPPDDTTHKIVTEWLRKANDDLNLADYLLTTGTAFPKRHHIPRTAGRRKILESPVNPAPSHLPENT